MPDEGVRLEDGTLIRAATVVCNADPKVALRLLGDHDVPQAFRDRLEAWQLRSPVVKFNAALNRLPTWTAAPGEDFPARGTVDVTTGLDDAQRAFERCARGEPAVGFGEIYVQTVHDPTPAPPGKHLLSVFGQYAPYEFDWDGRRDEVARQFIDLIAASRPTSRTASSTTRSSARPTSRRASASRAATSSRARRCPTRCGSTGCPPARRRGPVPVRRRDPPGGQRDRAQRPQRGDGGARGRAGTRGSCAERPSIPAVRRLLLAALLLLAGAVRRRRAAPFTVGTGQNPGIAIDDAGTVYVGWQVNAYGPGDAVQFCVVPPRAARAARSQVTIPFPGQGYNRSRVSRAAAGARRRRRRSSRARSAAGDGTFLARSTDGGRTFAPARHASPASSSSRRVQGPGGRVALVGGPTALRAGLFAADGSGAGAEGTALGAPVSTAQFNDIAAQGERRARRRLRRRRRRTPSGSAPAATRTTPAAGSRLPTPPLGREPELAGGPAGFAAMLEPSSAAPRTLFVQRLEGAGWSPPVRGHRRRPQQRLRSSLGNAQGPPDRAASPTRARTASSYTTSTDGGVLWSSRVDVGAPRRVPGRRSRSRPTRDGRGAAVIADSFDAKAMRVTRFTPRSAPVAAPPLPRRARAGAQRLRRRQARRSSSRPRAATAASRRRPCCAARASAAPAAPAAASARRFRAALRAAPRARARIPVRVIPRRGKARTLRLRVRRCGATLMFELNAANVLTLVRVALIPVLVAVLLSALPEADLLAAIVFVIASATDALDGWIARRRSKVTTFGKLMDPLADKLLITAALVSLVALYRLDAWVAMVIIAREFAVTGLRMLAIEQGQVISASVWGKLKTTTQVAMVLALIWVDRPAAWVDVLVYVTVAVTVLVRRRLLLPAAQAAGGRARRLRPAPSSHSRIET